MVEVANLLIYRRATTIEATHPSLTARRRRRFCSTVTGSIVFVKTAPAGVSVLLSKLRLIAVLNKDLALGFWSTSVDCGMRELKQYVLVTTDCYLIFAVELLVKLGVSSEC